MTHELELNRVNFSYEKTFCGLFFSEQHSTKKTDEVWSFHKGGSCLKYRRSWCGGVLGLDVFGCLFTTSTVSTDGGVVFTFNSKWRLLFLGHTLPGTFIWYLCNLPHIPVLLSERQVCTHHYLTHNYDFLSFFFSFYHTFFSKLKKIYHFLFCCVLKCVFSSKHSEVHNRKKCSCSSASCCETESKGELLWSMRL